MKLSINRYCYLPLISLLTFTLCAYRDVPQSEAKSSVESTREIRQDEISAVIMAIKDEIYDYSQEKSFFRIRSPAENMADETAKVSLYINPHLTADGMGEAIYKNFPYGEILRVFYVNPDGTVVLMGGPNIGFPITQPSHLTELMDKDELADDKAGWLHAEFAIQEKPSRSAVVQSARRQIKRVGFSSYLKIYIGLNPK